MKQEVLDEMKTKRIPKTVKTFGDLHDYIDANELGGFCEDAMFDALVLNFGGRDEHEGMPQGMLDYINECQEAIHTWLQEGRPK